MKVKLLTFRKLIIDEQGYSYIQDLTLSSVHNIPDWATHRIWSSEARCSGQGFSAQTSYLNVYLTTDKLKDLWQTSLLRNKGDNNI